MTERFSLDEQQVVAAEAVIAYSRLVVESYATNGQLPPGAMSMLAASIGLYCKDYEPLIDGQDERFTAYVEQLKEFVRKRAEMLRQLIAEVDNADIGFTSGEESAGE